MNRAPEDSANRPFEYLYRKHIHGAIMLGAHSPGRSTHRPVYRRAVIQTLMALSGVSQLGATTIVAEIGEHTPFASAPQQMA